LSRRLEVGDPTMANATDLASRQLRDDYGFAPDIPASATRSWRLAGWAWRWTSPAAPRTSHRCTLAPSHRRTVAHM